VKEYLKPCAYKPWERRRLRVAVTACLLKNEPASLCCVARLTCWRGAVAKASPNRAWKSRDQDPKLSDLPMARLKRG
jgi:hypothetical protein